MTEKRKVGIKASPTRSVILHVTERLILEEGYASVTSRRVAKEAGLTSALVHYYFPTTDDLFVAVYNQVQGRYRKSLDRALRSQQPLSSLWKVLTQPRNTALSVELIALANHRKAVGAHMSADIRQGRARQIEMLQGYLENRSPGEEGVDASSMLLGLIGIARLLVVDGALGATDGHGELNRVVEDFIRRIEEARPARRTLAEPEGKLP